MMVSRPVLSTGDGERGRGWGPGNFRLKDGAGNVLCGAAVQQEVGSICQYSGDRINQMVNSF